MEEIRLKATEKEIVSMIKSIFDKDVVTRTDNDLLLVEVDIENVLRSYVQAVVNVVRVKLGDKLFDIKEDGETLTIMIKDTVLAEPEYKSDDFCYNTVGRDIYAVYVDRENLLRLNKFTGGGEFIMNESTDKEAFFRFMTPQGAYMVPAGDYLVYDDWKERFYNVTKEDFERQARLKQPDLSGISGFPDYLDKKYGLDVRKRAIKLEEEYNELKEALSPYVDTGCMDYKALAHIIDELADVNLLIYHTAHLFGYTQKKLLLMAKDKIEKREKEPLYKRDVKPKEVCCGSCKYLEYEDITGNGVCREDGDLHGVGDCCSMYKPDIKTEEITSHDRNNR